MNIFKWLLDLGYEWKEEEREKKRKDKIFQTFWFLKRSCVDFLHWITPSGDIRSTSYILQNFHRISPLHPADTSSYVPTPAVTIDVWKITVCYSLDLKCHPRSRAGGMVSSWCLPWECESHHWRNLLMSLFTGACSLGCSEAGPRHRTWVIGVSLETTCCPLPCHLPFLIVSWLLWGKQSPYAMPFHHGACFATGQEAIQQPIKDWSSETVRRNKPVWLSVVFHRRLVPGIKHWHNWIK